MGSILGSPCFGKLPYFLHSLMDMGSLLGTAWGTALNHKRDTYFHFLGSFNKANIDNGSSEVLGLPGLSFPGASRLPRMSVVKMQVYCGPKWTPRQVVGFRVQGSGLGV